MYISSTMEEKHTEVSNQDVKLAPPVITEEVAWPPGLLPYGVHLCPPGLMVSLSPLASSFLLCAVQL